MKILNKLRDFEFDKYLSNRFSKEKISSYGGIALALLGIAGQLTQSQIGAIQIIGSMFGYDFSPALDAAIGLAAIVLPTSNINDAIKNRVNAKK